ncbi:leucine-rich repeat receptor protein kinase MSL1-like [Amborella trichopoda]|nr:leucine-rich repeat receptor protein kinase MSL1-like [Amborella trichopoda]|eukprot:XP_006838241.3 leucine-rich repeat receptor protein kinase MSL1-like [Amborella trichopoda]
MERHRLLQMVWNPMRKSSNTQHVIGVKLRNPQPDHLVRGLQSKILTRKSSKTLNGTISNSLFNLLYLEYLDVSRNNFHQSRIPLQLTNLKKLTYLNLSNSVFSGVLLDQFRNLSNLRYLDLSCSFPILDLSSVSYNLSSRRPSMNSVVSYYSYSNIYSPSLSWLEGLINLRDLRLDGVDLSGFASEKNRDWAEAISLLSNLRQLSLSDCGISGTIPVNYLLNLTSLSSLQLGFNSFLSHIPPQLTNFSSLSSLDLTSNLLGGTILYLPQLKEYIVDGNGDLGINISYLFQLPWPHLETISTRSCNSYGEIPNSISNVSSLVELQMSSSTIQGTVPDSIGNLSELQSLDLSFNSLTGNIPASLSNLRNLQVLSLYENNLDGQIPESVCQMSALETLNLAGNNFKGRIPKCINQLSQIQVFRVNNNYMDDTVPSIVSMFPKADPFQIDLSSSGLTVQTDSNTFSPNFQPEILSLHACNIKGKIPDFISNLTQIAILDLGNNSLTGTIPLWLWTLPKLSYLDLSCNHLHGTVPPSLKMNVFYTATHLNLADNNLQGPLPLPPDIIEVLDLSHNQFNGSIPTQIGERLYIAKYISLSGNKLTGPIPPSLCQENSPLMNLDLSNNSLSGTIPSQFGLNCKSLISLNLGINHFTGVLPDTLRKATNLRSLRLNDNQLEGLFPDFIQDLKGLEFLNLGTNKMEGEIPGFIGDLSKLRVLLLNFNSFNGSIPTKTTQLKNLQFMDLSQNQLVGSIPIQLSGFQALLQMHTKGYLLGYMIELTYLGLELEMVSKGLELQLTTVYSYNTGLDLSENQLEGEIPEDIGKLQGIYMLNLSRNKLSGQIPESIGNMISLESLDLSFNHLEGEIPASLTQLDYLGWLDLSNNNLSGRIPAGNHFDTLAKPPALAGNPFLCGPQISKSCSKGDDREARGEAMEERGTGKERLIWYVGLFLSYWLGFWGFLGFLSVKREWWGRYLEAMDEVAEKVVAT